MGVVFSRWFPCSERFIYSGSHNQIRRFNLNEPIKQGLWDSLYLQHIRQYDYGPARTHSQLSSQFLWLTIKRFPISSNAYHFPERFPEHIPISLFPVLYSISSPNYLVASSVYNKIPFSVGEKRVECLQIRIVFPGPRGRGCLSDQPGSRYSAVHRNIVVDRQKYIYMNIRYVDSKSET